MRIGILLLLITISVLLTGCNEKKSTGGLRDASPSPEGINSNLIQIAAGISYDVIILPVENSDPWEFEKLAGLDKKRLLDNMFNDIYESRVVASDFFTGEALSIKEIKALEKEFNNDRTKIAKLQFDEDWFLNPETGQIVKVVSSVTAGYALTDFDGRRIGYKAIFRINYQNVKSNP